MCPQELATLHWLSGAPACPCLEDSLWVPPQGKGWLAPRFCQQSSLDECLHAPQDARMAEGSLEVTPVRLLNSQSCLSQGTGLQAAVPPAAPSSEWKATPIPAPPLAYCPWLAWILTPSEDIRGTCRRDWSLGYGWGSPLTSGASVTSCLSLPTHVCHQLFSPSPSSLVGNCAGVSSPWVMSSGLPVG